MKKLIVTFALAGLLVVPSASAVTPQEIMTLAQIGVSADEMIKAIDRDKTIFKLQVSEILELKKAGVPDKVLKYMLKTPQIFGDGQGTGTPGPGTGTGTTSPEEMTPEERAALEERQRAEAQRLAEEAKKAEASQRQAFAQGILKRGMDQANAKACVPAIGTFLDFIQQGGYQRGTDEHYTAWYGIAFALSQCGMYQSAAKYYVDVLLEGAEKQFFQKAFWELRAIRQKINYSPPDLEELTRFSVVGFSKTFQDEYNYFLGEFFYDYNNYQRAVTYFEQVGEESPEYGKSSYLTGLVQVQTQLYRSAVQSFQGAITATERNKSDREVSELSYLALARIAYEAENFDAAIFYYRKIPGDSVKLATAFYESAWTYFIKGDYSRALGTFQALHSPFFNHYFYPELWILEATVYVNMCHYQYAREAIKQFDSSVSALAIPLKSLLSKLRTPMDYYKALEGIAMADKKFQMDRRVVYPVLANVEFYNLHKTVKQIDWEIAEIEKVKTQLGQFGADLHAKLQSLRQSRVNEAGIKVQQVLKQLEAELANFAVKKTEIEIDLSVQEMERQTLELQGQDVPEDTTEVEVEGSTAIVGSDSMSWRFEGEYWKDAIGGFRSFLPTKCVAN